MFEHTGPTSRPTTTCQTNSSRSSSTNSTCSTAAEYSTRTWAGTTSIGINRGADVELAYRVARPLGEGMHGLLVVADGPYIEYTAVYAYLCTVFVCVREGSDSRAVGFVGKVCCLYLAALPSGERG